MGRGEGANKITHQNMLQKILHTQTGDVAGEGRYSDIGLFCSRQLLLPPCPSSASWLRSSTGSGRPWFLPSTSSAPMTKWSSPFISASTSRGWRSNSSMAANFLLLAGPLQEWRQPNSWKSSSYHVNCVLLTECSPRCTPLWLVSVDHVGTKPGQRE